MADPWLTIIGLGEDGAEGLASASRKALDSASIVFGGARHLALAGIEPARARAWPRPFDLAPLLALRGRQVAVLASGDPFWFGAGGSLARHLRPDEWRAFPGPSVFSLAAARLGWRLEDTACLGLHAAPPERLVPLLAPGRQIIVTLADGAAPAALADWLVARGYGDAALTRLCALGGPREEITTATAKTLSRDDAPTPVALAIVARGGDALPQASGLDDSCFAHDGQITKRPVRAMTLSALAPRANDMLWDLGAGSGSVAVEWLLAAPGSRAVAVEPRADRCANITANARAFGLDHRLTLKQGRSQAVIADLPAPDAVFVGGGCDDALLTALWQRLTPGKRLVVNAVTLETQTLVMRWHARQGGQLLRLDLAEAAPLGQGRAWQPARPLLQWSVTR